jgi:hypothetical protein
MVPEHRQVWISDGKADEERYLHDRLCLSFDSKGVLFAVLLFPRFPNYHFSFQGVLQD